MRAKIVDIVGVVVKGIPRWIDSSVDPVGRGRRGPESDTKDAS